MRARSTRWLGALTVLGGAVFAVSSLAAGCGGKTDEENATPQPQPDTGVVIVDSAPDTATTPDTAKPDTGSSSSGGSIFDAEIPDVTFDGGTTAKGCYDCTIDKCKSEVEACDADEKCRTLFLCILTDCGGSVTDFSCALPCALSAGITSTSDPVVGKVSAIGTCNQANCKDACPALPDGGLGDAPSEASTDASGDASGDASDGAADVSSFAPSTPGTPGFAEAKSIDPKVLEVLAETAWSFSSAEARRGIVDRMKR